MKICIFSTAGTGFTDGLWSHMRSEGRYPLSWAQCLAWAGHDLTVTGPGATWGCQPPLPNVRLQDYPTEGEKYDVYLGVSYLPEELIKCDAKVELHCAWGSLLGRIEQTYPEYKGYKLKANRYLTYAHRKCEEMFGDNGHWGDKYIYLPWPLVEKFGESKYDCKEITWTYRMGPSKGNMESAQGIRETMKAMVDVANDLDLTCNFLMSSAFKGEDVAGTGVEEVMMSAKRKNLYDSLPFNEYLSVLSRSKATVAISGGPNANMDPISQGTLPIMWGQPVVLRETGKKYGWVQPTGYDSIKDNLYDLFESRDRYDSIIYSCQKEFEDSLYSNAIVFFDKIVKKALNQ